MHIIPLHLVVALKHARRSKSVCPTLKCRTFCPRSDSAPLCSVPILIPTSSFRQARPERSSLRSFHHFLKFCLGCSKKHLDSLIGLETVSLAQIGSPARGTCSRLAERLFCQAVLCSEILCRRVLKETASVAEGWVGRLSAVYTARSRGEGVGRGDCVGFKGFRARHDEC